MSKWLGRVIMKVVSDFSHKIIKSGIFQFQSLRTNIIGNTIEKARNLAIFLTPTIITTSNSVPSQCHLRLHEQKLLR